MASSITWRGAGLRARGSAAVTAPRPADTFLFGTDPRTAEDERATRYFAPIAAALLADGVTPKAIINALASLLIEIGLRSDYTPAALVQALNSAAAAVPRVVQLRAAKRAAAGNA